MIDCTKDLDIRLISCWYPWYPAVFSDVSSFLLSDHQSTDIWLIFRYIPEYSAEICQILNLKFDQFSLDVRLLYLWYPADILNIWCTDFQQSVTPWVWGLVTVRCLVHRYSRLAGCSTVNEQEMQPLELPVQRGKQRWGPFANKTRGELRAPWNTLLAQGAVLCKHKSSLSVPLCRAQN